jgi:AraC family transcriptional regulator
MFTPVRPDSDQAIKNILMTHLPRGQFYGQTNETIHLHGITLTDTEYTLDKVDWHYHENPYFTFILQGNLIEGNKKEIYNCSAGTLLFHNWQEPHYNIKPKGFARGFHIELEQQWINNYEINLNDLQGNVHVADPGVKILLYRIVKESKRNDTTSDLAIQDLVLQTLAGMKGIQKTYFKNNPHWVKKANEILHDTGADKITLVSLSKELNIHPVHLSRDFPRYFHCGLGEYMRKLKIEKSLTLLPKKDLPLTAIALECGFSDQSHFTRCFKELIGMQPLAYRKLLCL